jgi:hypothetical protein
MATKPGVLLINSALDLGGHVRIDIGGGDGTGRGDGCERNHADGQQNLVAAQVRREQRRHAPELVHYDPLVAAPAGCAAA